MLPLDMLSRLTESEIEACARAAKTGNYRKIAKAMIGVMAAKLDLNTCKPADLEQIHGFGPKTSRFFIMWIRPTEIYAALDVHILRWMGTLGYDVPRATPQNLKTYARLEALFIEEARKRGKLPRDLDYEIWIAGAGRTQETALPENQQPS